MVLLFRGYRTAAAQAINKGHKANDVEALWGKFRPSPALYCALSLSLSRSLFLLQAARINQHVKQASHKQNPLQLAWL